jgi:Ca2+/H+ antiporter
MPKVAQGPWWAWTWPVLAFAVLIATMYFGAAGAMAALAGGILIAAVFAAVYHAEVVAHRVGEPFGTLVLALAVTIIEVALIVSVMVGVSGDKSRSRAGHCLRSGHDRLQRRGWVVLTIGWSAAS